MLHRPLLDDLRAAADRVLTSGRYILGPEVAAFEQELGASLGIPFVVGLSSGTDAVLALLLAVGVQAGDDVVTSPYSFFATTEAILRLGARPVFADIDAATMNMDPAQAARSITPRTKAVLVVHLFGRAVPLDGLRDACVQRGVALLEDAAQAIGVPGLAAADGAAVSFFPAKNLGGFGDAGAVLTRDERVAQRVRALRNHGAAGDKWRHELVGGNFRLDELQAALLRVKLPHLASWTQARQGVAAAYHDLLAGLPIALPPADARSVWNQFVIRVGAGQRDAVREHLRQQGIASAVYYPTPVHLQPALRHLGGRAGDYPNAERAAAESLALPIFPGLSNALVQRVAAALAAFFR